MLLSQRSIIFICAVFLIFQQLTTGLTCYECPSCNTVNNNTNTRTVPDGAGYSCYKATVTALGVSLVNRGAIVKCVSGSDSTVGVSGSIQCCTTDLCNNDNIGNIGIALSTSFSLAILTIAISVLFRATIIG